jgi:cation diffusion facilitator family transporter
MKLEQSKIIGLQKWVFIVSVLLLLFKLTAWVYTGSVAILTDALESIVNVVAGIMGLYSLNLSNKPKDTEHPYGHGKVEFITSAIEGVLIMVAALFIVFEATQHLLWYSCVVVNQRS